MQRVGLSVARGRRRVHGCWLCGVALLLVALLPHLASANNFGNPWNESNFQRYWYEPASFDSDWVSQMNQTRTSQINPTNMFTQNVSNHADSDVAAYMRNIANNLVGLTQCIASSSGGSICNHWHVTFNTDFNPYSSSQKLHISCHEFGHTLGLRHYPNTSTTTSCMKVPSSTAYSSHDVSHINGYYPNNPNGDQRWEGSHTSSEP